MSRAVPIADRFWSRVRKTEKCWLWEGYKDKFGYGMLGRGRRGSGWVFTHRFSWELHFGPILGGKHVLHRCDNPPCVNPDHLFLGTARDNMRDMRQKGRCWTQTSPWLAARGEGNGFSKLSTLEVKKIRSLYATGRHSQEWIAGKFDVTQAHVSRLVLRKAWGHA
jgi:hypothetical protein